MFVNTSNTHTTYKFLGEEPWNKMELEINRLLLSLLLLNELIKNELISWHHRPVLIKEFRWEIKPVPPISSFWVFAPKGGWCWKILRFLEGGRLGEKGWSRVEWYHHHASYAS